MKRILIGLALLAAACTDSAGGNSSGFRTFTGVRVNPINEAVFEVIPIPASVEEQFWCGAGEYARRVLGAPQNAQVYVVSGVGPGLTMQTKSAAQFSLSPQASGASGVQGTWGPRLGDNKFVGDASRKCNRDPNRFTP
ncbi:hypothetical protein [Shimia sp.]|uniref:hypothetical protein n=1 Tax=Shimia sp. TaxID=1954381 RepID=UPI00329717E7